MVADGSIAGRCSREDSGRRRSMKWREIKCNSEAVEEEEESEWM